MSDPTELIPIANPKVDANDGEIGSLDRQIGNRTYGQGVFLTGASRRIPVSIGDVDWVNNEPLTVSTTVLQISANLRDNDRALITVESQAIRFQFDGSEPTATSGHQAEDGDIITLAGKGEVENFRVIRRDGSDSTLRVTVGMRQ